MDSLDDATTDPRHVFLTATDVLHRYGWGKTKGYQNLKDRELIPEPISSPKTVRISCARSHDGLTAPDPIRVTVVGATSTSAAS